jgi:signal transduction histidine kinase
MQAVSSSIHKIGKQEKDRVEFNPVVRTSDEIGQLQKNLSELVDELNRANQQIKEMHVSQMVRADQLANVGEMAASIAHEIRNPVAGVQGALEIIKSEIQHDEPRKEIIEEMQTQLKRVNKAITDLLSYARPSAPHFVISDLSNLTRKTASLLTRQTQEKKINLQILNVTEIPDIFIDEKLIQQVFFNIIMNAIDAVKEDGRIQIYLSSIDDRVVIKFSNNGEAIPENKRESIFKPFFTTKHKGTGLGLAISKKIIEQHNGTIRLDTTLNTGTTFIIELPTKQG